MNNQLYIHWYCMSNISSFQEICQSLIVIIWTLVLRYQYNISHYNIHRTGHQTTWIITGVFYYSSYTVVMDTTARITKWIITIVFYNSSYIVVMDTATRLMENTHILIHYWYIPLSTFYVQWERCFQFNTYALYWNNVYSLSYTWNCL